MDEPEQAPPPEVELNSEQRVARMEAVLKETRAELEAMRGTMASLEARTVAVEERMLRLETQERALGQRVDEMHLKMERLRGLFAAGDGEMVLPSRRQLLH